MSDSIAHALAGASGGIISMAITYPLITVSTRAQIRRGDPAAADPASSQPIQSTLQSIKAIIAKEGLSGIFAGLNSALIGIGLTNGVYYYFYEWTREMFEYTTRRKGMTTAESATAGAIAGAATVFITNPIWVVNTRMTVRKESMEESFTNTATSSSDTSTSNSTHHRHHRRPRRMSTRRTIFRIIRDDGILGFWQGVVPSLILVINPIIQYTVFEQLKNRLARGRGDRGLQGRHFFILGAVSKMVATSVTYPYIVVKSRMQLRQSATNEQLRYRSVSDGFRKIIRDEGIAGLYKGIYSKLLQSVLTAAFLFYYKEVLYKYAVVLLLVLGIRRHRSNIV